MIHQPKNTIGGKETRSNFSKKKREKLLTSCPPDLL